MTEEELHTQYLQEDWARYRKADDAGEPLPAIETFEEWKERKKSEESK